VSRRSFDLRRTRRIEHSGGVEVGGDQVGVRRAGAAARLVLAFVAEPDGVAPDVRKPLAPEKVVRDRDDDDLRGRRQPLRHAREHRPEVLASSHGDAQVVERDARLVAQARDPRLASLDARGVRVSEEEDAPRRCALRGVVAMIDESEVVRPVPEVDFESVRRHDAMPDRAVRRIPEDAVGVPERRRAEKEDAGLVADHRDVCDAHEGFPEYERRDDGEDENGEVLLHAGSFRDGVRAVRA
jgi:hypothetical protein